MPTVVVLDRRTRSRINTVKRFRVYPSTSRDSEVQGVLERFPGSTYVTHVSRPNGVSVPYGRNPFRSDEKQGLPL